MRAQSVSSARSMTQRCARANAPDFCPTCTSEKPWSARCWNRAATRGFRSCTYPRPRSIPKREERSIRGFYVPMGSRRRAGCTSATTMTATSGLRDEAGIRALHYEKCAARLQTDPNAVRRHIGTSARARRCDRIAPLSFELRRASCRVAPSATRTVEPSTRPPISGRTGAIGMPVRCWSVSAHGWCASCADGARPACTFWRAMAT